MRNTNPSTLNCTATFTAKSRRGAAVLSRKFYVEHVWNVMAHAQKPYLVFQRNGRVHLNRWGSQFSRPLAVKECGSAWKTMSTPCSEAQCKSSGYPLQSPISPSLPLPRVTVCHHVSNGLYGCIKRPHIPQHAHHRLLCTRRDPRTWWEIVSVSVISVIVYGV